MTDTTFKPGEVVRMIVGLPGPDLDDATILFVNPDGTYAVKFQVYGQGPWHEGVGYPNERRIGGIFKKVHHD